MKRVTKETFELAKRNITRYGKRNAMTRFQIGFKTAVQIEASKDYRMYRQQVKAQHPQIKYSLRDDVLDLHRITFDKHDNQYLSPGTAKKAIAQLLAYV